MTETIEFPLCLISDLDEIPVASDVQVRRMEVGDRLRLLGVESVDVGEDGRLKSVNGARNNDLFNAALALGFAGIDKLYSSNFVATLSSRDDAIDLNFALKLLGASFTSLFIGFQGERTRHLVSPPCYYGEKALTIRHSDVALLSRLLELKRRSSDPKLTLMSEKLLYAFSTAPRPESRFLELSIILEMLLLPSSSSELSYRFALRMAKFLAKYADADAGEGFKEGRQIYKARSSLVHTGRDQELAVVEPLAEEYVRQLLTAYVTNPERFHEAALDDLCLSG